MKKWMLNHKLSVYFFYRSDRHVAKIAGISETSQVFCRRKREEEGKTIDFLSLFHR